MIIDYKLNKIYNKDSLEFLKERADYEFDINYSDPPYALGSEVIIRPDGKVDYKKANDFMNKWEMPTGEYWEQWFKEAYRTLKHGGYCIMFGIDRQLLLFKYYANLAGFEEQQSLYWYFISNFPKATDLSKMIDKNAGAEREVIGKQSVPDIRGDAFSVQNDKQNGSYENIEVNITAPSTDLAKKYNGYKYSISPLKQTNETIMVFRKPYKSGSCLHDTLAFENGDNECRCGALNIDGNRVEPLNEKDTYDVRHYQSEDCFQNLKPKESQFLIKPQPEGRYPSQTFCDSNTAEVLDKQSGISKGGTPKLNSEINRVGLKEDAPAFNSNNSGIDVNKGQGMGNYGDTGGCSKILHKCDYEKEDYDIYNYQPKVSKSERNAGCDNLPIKERVFNGTSESSSKDIKDVEARFTTSPTSNNHPTLKPIKLNERILKLFKTPNDDKIVFPFAGAGSEVIGGIKAGFKNWVGCEINPEYVEIAKARIDYWTTQDEQLDIFNFKDE